MTRTPVLALALAALARPAAAQEEPAPVEGTPAAEAATEGAQADAAESQGGTGALVSGEGAQVGRVSVSVAASGQTLVTVRAEGVAEGVRGLHLHETGACEGPAFETAGGHVAGDRDHGIMAASGPQRGTCPTRTRARTASSPTRPSRRG